MALKRWLKRFVNREVILYIIVGVLTTLVNLGVFTWLSHIWGADRWWLANFPAILAAVLFSFVCNRIFVFRSRGQIWRELAKFLLTRLAVSLAFEYGAMFVLYNLLGLEAGLIVMRWEISISKLLTQILVMIANYVLGKFVVFNRPGEVPEK